MPTAMIPMVLIPCSTLKMLRRVKKYGLANDSPTQSVRSATSTPNSRAANSRCARRGAAPLPPVGRAGARLPLCATGALIPFGVVSAGGNTNSLELFL